MSIKGRMAPIRLLLLLLAVGCSIQCFLQPNVGALGGRNLGSSLRAKKADAEGLVPPKRPLSSYMLFAQDIRASVVKKLGTNSVAEVGKVIGDEWGKLTAAKKKPYEEKAAKAKQTFEKEMEKFTAAGGVMPARKKKGEGKKKARDPNMPKRSPSAYFLWLADSRESIKKKLPADHKVTDVSKEAGQQWAKVTAAKKKPYETKAAKLKSEYQEAMEKYKASL